jgi:malate/lactate dehydrogenase
MSDEEFQGYCKGNAMKYLWRYKYKGKPVEDLKKAQWYLEKLIASVQNV